MLKKICPICDSDTKSEKVYDENLPSKLGALPTLAGLI